MDLYRLCDAVRRRKVSHAAGLPLYSSYREIHMLRIAFPVRGLKS